MNNIQMLILILGFSNLVPSLSMSLRCSIELAKVNQSISNPAVPKEYSNMYKSSGIFLNDLGKYDLCNSIPIARFVVAIYSKQRLLFQTFCGPISCSEDDYKEIVFQYSNRTDFEIFFPKEFQDEHYRAYSAKAIVMISIIFILVLLCSVAALADLIVKAEKRNSNWFKYLSCFSILKNAYTLIAEKKLHKLGETSNLDIVDALRALSIGWVIFGHSGTVLLRWAPIGNLENVYNESKRVFYNLDFSAIYAVDTFLWLSGFLFTYFFMAELEKPAPFTPKKLLGVYLHRFFRIVPLYMFVLFFYFSLQEYLGSGPLYFDISRLTRDCGDYWYSNLFFINNFIPDNKGNACLDPSWYLATDMQQYIIAPFIVLAYMKISKTAGWIIIGLYIAIGCVLGGYTASLYNPNVALLGMSVKDSQDFYDYYYIKPYSRMPSYGFGIMSAFIVYSSKKFKEYNTTLDKFAVNLAKMQENLKIRISSFVLGIIFISTIMILIYDVYQYPGKNNDYTHFTRSFSIIYYYFDRIVFSLGLTFILLPLFLGHFGFISKLLTGFIWTFLSRLSFAMYLIHYSIIQSTYLSQKTSYVVSVYTFFNNSIFFFVVSVVCAIPFTLLVEMPASGIESILFHRNGRSNEEKLVLYKDSDLLIKDQ